MSNLRKMESRKRRVGKLAVGWGGDLTRKTLKKPLVLRKYSYLFIRTLPAFFRIA